MTTTQAELLRRFMTEAPAQLATNLWRCVEVPVLAAALPAAGFGLDIGCGDGHLTKLLRELAGADWRLVGIDPDLAEADLGRRSGQYERVHACGADRIPEPAGAFDFAFANSVLEHIPDVPPCLREVARVLKPGGLFAATVPSAHFHGCLRGPTAARLRPTYLADLDDRLAHRHYWPAERWAAELTAAGFVPGPAVPYCTRRQVRRWELLSHWTGGLLHRLGGRARKPIEIQRGLRVRRGLPGPLRRLAGPLAAAAGAGVLADRDPHPARNGGLLVVARKG